MKWVQVDKYHMKSGDFILAKYFSYDKVQYGISKNNVNYGYFANVNDAKQKAKELL
jgi:hypothetical protein